MAGEKPRVFACSCEDTMPLDAETIRRGLPDSGLRTCRQLCRSQLDLFRAALAEAGPLVVGCTQEAPLFEEVAGESGFAAPLTFANLRETGGWSAEARAAGPKMAALLAAAALDMPDTPMVSLKSEGVALVYGRDATAIDLAHRLADVLDVTVLLTRPGEIVPPRRTDFPVLKGTIKTAKGHLGAFELTVDGFAQPAPSSRAGLAFGPERNGTVSRCDIVIDVSGGVPLFPAHDLRPGYLRADPGDRAAVERLAFEASQLVGEFDKPRYVAFDAALCAHSRSRKTGCTRCLDLCPTGAITPAGDHVAIDPAVCAGCGACAAVCPTGAATYALPPAGSLLARLRAMLVAYAETGGRTPVLLLHDADHGEPLIDALARFGDGLPANVLPVAVNEVTQVGLDVVAAAMACGAAAVRFLTRARPKHDLTGLYRTIDYANAVLRPLGFGEGLAATIETDDPDGLAAALAAVKPGTPPTEPARFLPLGSGRELLSLTMRELHRAAPTPVDVVPMPERAPFGTVHVDTEGCTLCLACVSACPTGALSDDPDRPTLRFSEDRCVQCGLCQATCPEKVISLEPRIDFGAWGAPPKVVKEEEPFHCISCGKPFGTRSTIERIVARLEGKHWMFAGENARRIAVVKMCDDCRVEAVVNEGFDPHGATERPKPRMSEDYLRERDAANGKDPLA
ncbi:4Fe-4S binding protein [Chelatococcus sp. SYSU_G07232]|uniref:4Fe-4S binding protein n=1 Tax=Chelatococcus albus TaxID=3047466 RepID=A0ABT7AM01_9HYPH|nr:4Fe-4S binding protein [Chelatococcus sp. SYSU_G07232]MDJ1159611.1 4Fe-4S binding protein [Chelatococcus sp. SYSU_G07232]